MRAAAQKLNNRRGVSILLAIMLLLVATMVSVTILSAALSAAHRVASDKEQEQLRLAVDSAARLLRQDIESSDCTITETVVVTQEGEEDPIENPPTYDYEGHGVLGFALNTAVTSIRQRAGSEDNPSVHLSLNVAPDNYDEEPVVAVATLDFTMHRYDPDDIDSRVEKFQISGTVTVAGGNQKIYLTAWVPTVDTRARETTDEPEEGLVVQTTVTTETLRWRVNLSTGVQE